MSTPPQRSTHKYDAYFMMQAVLSSPPLCRNLQCKSGSRCTAAWGWPAPHSCRGPAGHRSLRNRIWKCLLSVKEQTACRWLIQHAYSWRSSACADKCPAKCAALQGVCRKTPDGTIQNCSISSTRFTSSKCVEGVMASASIQVGVDHQTGCVVGAKGDSCSLQAAYICTVRCWCW